MQRRSSKGEGRRPKPVRRANLPVVAIIGRPNAGKSMLFNRLVSAPRAIVSDIAGVTRDRNVDVVNWQGREVLLVDTGGFEDRDKGELPEAIRNQARVAADEADVLIALLDGRAGLSPEDRHFARVVLQIGKPTIWAVNKLDSSVRDDDVNEFYALGVDELLPISSAHGRGHHRTKNACGGKIACRSGRNAVGDSGF